MARVDARQDSKSTLGVGVPIVLIADSRGVDRRQVADAVVSGVDGVLEVGSGVDPKPSVEQIRSVQTENMTLLDEPKAVNVLEARPQHKVALPKIRESPPAHPSSTH